MTQEDKAPYEARLSHAQARTTYRRLRGLLALSTRYESLATRKLIAAGDFSHAQAVFEFGCGTGHFAAEILHSQLPNSACYQAIDITPELVESARSRLEGFGPRVQIHLSNGAPPQPETGRLFDRFVSTFVLDLLPMQEITAVLDAAYTMLEQDGLLCLASLAPGKRGLSRPVMRIWEAIYRTAPSIVGGCRPLELQTLLPAHQWRIRHHDVVGPLGIPLESVVAEKVTGP